MQPEPFLNAMLFVQLLVYGIILFYASIWMIFVLDWLTRRFSKKGFSIIRWLIEWLS